MEDRDSKLELIKFLEDEGYDYWDAAETTTWGVMAAIVRKVKQLESEIREANPVSSLLKGME